MIIHRHSSCNSPTSTPYIARATHDCTVSSSTRPTSYLSFHFHCSCWRSSVPLVLLYDIDRVAFSCRYGCTVSREHLMVLPAHRCFQVCSIYIMAFSCSQPYNFTIPEFVCSHCPFIPPHCHTLFGYLLLPRSSRCLHILHFTRMLCPASCTPFGLLYQRSTDICMLSGVLACSRRYRPEVMEPVARLASVNASLTLSMDLDMSLRAARSCSSSPC